MPHQTEPSANNAMGGLLQASLSAAKVQNDDAGNSRLVKKASNNTARDDVASALTLAAGAFVPYPAVDLDETRAPILVG